MADLPVPAKGRITLFVLAGEHSGDRLGADLVRRLRTRLPVDLYGVGGGELAAEGMRPIFPMGDLSVMGFWDVLWRMPLLLWRISETVRAILSLAPDGVVLIDAQVFSRMVAKRLRRSGFRRPILLYVCPSVWGRAPERAVRLVPLFDEVMAVLPFEPAVMERLGGPRTRYVGHPSSLEAQPRTGSAGQRVALLPGSRPGELRLHLPLLRAVAESLAHRQDLSFFMPTLPALAAGLTESVRDWPVAVEIVADRSKRGALYNDTLLAVTVAGTATLELALACVPMVVTFVMDAPQARAFQRLSQPQVSLPNIILNAHVVPEIVLGRPDPAPLVAAVTALANSEEARAVQQRAFTDLLAMMEEGVPGAPREDPAERVLFNLDKAQRLSSGV